MPREHSKEEAGVVEAYPGILESVDIDPLHHEASKGTYDTVSRCRYPVPI